MKTVVSIVGRSRIGLSGIVVAIGTVCLTFSACTTNSKYIPDDLVGEWKEPHGSLVLRADGTYRRVIREHRTDGTFEVVGNKLVFAQVVNGIDLTGRDFYKFDETPYYLSETGLELGLDVGFRESSSSDVRGKWVFTDSSSLLGDDGGTTFSGRSHKQVLDFEPDGKLRLSDELTVNNPGVERTTQSMRLDGTYHTEGDGWIRVLFADDSSSSDRGGFYRFLDNGALVWQGSHFTRSGFLDASSNHAPQLQLTPLRNRTVAWGQRVEYDLVATDQDGDTLEIMVAGRPLGATFELFGNRARFSWTPNGTDVRYDPHGLTFFVRDPKGGYHQQHVSVTVLDSDPPADGVPYFVGPFSYQLNLNTGSTLAFLVNVRDDDSARVTLRAIQNIEGARFESMGPKLATFTWRPTREQIAAQSVWFLTVGAKDEAHDEVTQDFTITIRR